MDNTEVRAVAETVFDRNQRREAEINIALEEEAARHQAALKNMHRLRALRLARDEKLNAESPAASGSAVAEVAAAPARERRTGRKSAARSGARRGD